MAGLGRLNGCPTAKAQGADQGRLRAIHWIGSLLPLVTDTRIGAWQFRTHLDDGMMEARQHGTEGSLIDGLWLMATGALIALPSWRLRDLERAKALLAENRRVLGGRFGSSRTDDDSWVENIRSIATWSTVLGACLFVLGIVWLVVAAVAASF